MTLSGVPCLVRPRQNVMSAEHGAKEKQLFFGLNNSPKTGSRYYLRAKKKLSTCHTLPLIIGRTLETDYTSFMSTTQ